MRCLEWPACTLWTRSLRTHPFALDAPARPGETAVRTALSPRYLIRPPWLGAATRMRIGHARPSSALVRQRPLVYGRFSFQDEAAGSSPARPTTPRLSCGNARRWSVSSRCFWAAPRHRGLRTHPCTAVPRNFTMMLRRDQAEHAAVSLSMAAGVACAGGQRRAHCRAARPHRRGSGGACTHWGRVRAREWQWSRWLRSAGEGELGGQADEHRPAGEVETARRAGPACQHAA